MVIKLVIALLAHLILALIAILVGKYVPNMVNKSNSREVFSFIYCCALPILNLVVILIGITELMDIGIRKLSNYIMKRWL